jgi:hypothetical protein
MKILIESIICIVICYLTFAFIKADINFNNWHEGTRVALCLFCIVCLSAIIIIEKTKEK